MAFRFSLRTTLTCLVLALLFGRLSLWQWDRYHQKLVIVETLNENLKKEVSPIEKLISESSDGWDPLLHRRVSVSGTYDYEHEVTLRNRRHAGYSGVHVITPFKIDGSDRWILVNRGFIPLEFSSREDRKKFRKGTQDSFTGLVKESMRQKLFSPADPETGQGHPWVDSWLRIDLPKISRQIPYPILPVYLEIAASSDAQVAVEEVVAASTNGRDELLAISGQGLTQSFGMRSPDLQYPIPTFNTIIPPDRHLGYVYEWGTMAVAVLLIGLVVQFRRPRIGVLTQKSSP